MENENMTCSFFLQGTHETEAASNGSLSFSLSSVLEILEKMERGRESIMHEHASVVAPKFVHSW